MKPLIVQSDLSMLLEVDNPAFIEARNFLIRFAEIIKSPEIYHTYKITQLSLWNALSSKVTKAEILEGLSKYARHQVPDIVISQIEDICDRFGRVRMFQEGEQYLVSADQYIINQILHARDIAPYVKQVITPELIEVDHYSRGEFKRRMIRIAYPVLDEVGYAPGSPLTFKRKNDFSLRFYQEEAAEIFYDQGRPSGGSGVITLPCGSGKTIVGIAIMEKVQAETLILTTSITAVHQWIAELKNRTDIDPDTIGEYSGEVKDIKPITVATYQIMTANRDGVFTHYELFNQRNWGLIIYDEVHMLPAPVFQITSQMQSKRRLGLTATLVREDGLERDVFCLIGSKKYDMAWKELELQGFIAAVSCQEIRIPLAPKLRLPYSVAPGREQHRIAGENSNKDDVIERLIKRHQDDRIIIIGLFLDQLQRISARFNCPLIKGSTSNKIRDQVYQQFKDGEINLIVLSKVGNFAIDLPNANVAIEVSGTYGSRQEEAQRVGRILRPKEENNQSYFYTLVTGDTCEQIYAAKRQLFMIEQGYKYQIIKYDPDTF